MPPESDVIRVRHMLESARSAISFAAGRSRADLDGDPMLVHALVHVIQIVGEAATQVSAETRRHLPEVPWADIVGMRNRLIHAYHDVDLNVVWDTVDIDLPPLVATLEAWLKAEE